MSLPVEFYPKARSDLQELQEEAREKVFELLDKLEEEGLCIREVDRWEDNRGRMVFRIKVKEDRGGDVDHRVFFDIKDGRAIIYGVFH